MCRLYLAVCSGFLTVCTVLCEGTAWFNAEFPFISQRGVCSCERGYTEVMRSNGLLDYCVKVPGLEDKKADVKTIAGKNKPVNSKMHDIFKGWSIQPFNPGEKLKYERNRLSLEGFCGKKGTSFVDDNIRDFVWELQSDLPVSSLCAIFHTFVPVQRNHNLLC